MTTSIPRHAGPPALPLTVPTLALFGSVTAVLGGGWLVLAPFALGYQPAGAGWADATIADFTTGLVLLGLGAIATAVFTASLIARLRPPRPHPAARGVAPDVRPTDPEPDSDLVALLRPLVAALERDDATNSTGTPAADPNTTDPAVRS